MNSWRQGGWSAVQLTYAVMLAILVPALLYLYFTYSYGGEHIAAQAFIYPQGYEPAAQCSERSGTLADHQRLATSKNIDFNVTTPANYRADFPHALLMVWAPSGFSDKLAERFTGLTGAATGQGYIVVHVASVALGIRSLAELGTIPEQVMATWCIAKDQVYYTGHSDGGTVSNALAVLEERSIAPAAIAPSAMGMQGVDMEAYQCPAPTNVMLMHNKGDGHFPDYGTQVASWWAQCNQCGEPSPAPSHPGCIEYASCKDDVRTLFCEAEGNHGYWPGFHHNVLGFFAERDAYVSPSNKIKNNEQAADSKP